ncbi:MAG: hypothetical protein IIB87_08560 [Chloroflexi bacterium]|nr:hypothetical protein [Chloroflexota bacterium]
MTEVYDLVRSIAQSVQDSLTVRTVYGEPITAGNITILPVARVTFGFGGGGAGGSGSLPAGEEIDAARRGAGGVGGGGGGGFVQPIGYIEITENASRWVPVEPSQSEQLLRALKVAARLVPFGGRRGWLLGALALAAQTLIGRVTRVTMPPDGLPPTEVR